MNFKKIKHRINEIETILNSSKEFQEYADWCRNGCPNLVSGNPQISKYLSKLDSERYDLLNKIKSNKI